MSKSQKKCCGIFCFTNSTNRPIYWCIKGLHIKWIIPPTISSPEDPDYEMLDYRDSNTSWGSLVRFKLNSKTYCYGEFPFCKFSSRCIIFCEFHTHQSAVRRPIAIPTQTAVDNTDNTSIHTKSTQQQESLVDIKVNKSVQTSHKSQLICKSYLIDHRHKHDIIIEAKVATSLFLFSDYSTFSLEPVSYRLFPDYKPLTKKKAPVLMLDNNISYDQMKPVLSKTTKRSKKTQQKTTMTSSFESLNLYDYESVESLKEGILFYQTLLRELKERVNLLVIKVHKDKIVEEDKMHGYLSKYVRTDDSNTNVFLLKYDGNQLKYSDVSTWRSLMLVNQSGQPILENIDGVIVFSKVGKSFNSWLKNTLQNLEGFPVLFIFSGLENSENIYDALSQKAKTEQELLDIYSSTHKPMIIHHRVKTQLVNAMEGIAVCKFLREAIDITMERVVEKLDKKLFLEASHRVLQLHAFNKEIEMLEERQSKKHAWFFGLNNEIESISIASRTIKLKNIHKVACVRKREQFTNGKDLLPQFNKDNIYGQINFVKEIGKNISGLLNRAKEKSEIENKNSTIQNDDIVILCVELSGRLLITGNSGIFTTFAQEILKYTSNLVLFIDRLDRNSSENPYVDVNSDKLGSIRYGDKHDLLLDEDLKQTQQIEQYFKYRCYHWSKRDNASTMEPFWKLVFNV